MKQRSRSLPVLVLVAAVALVLGSFGAAVAGPVITKAKVRQIATKVVKKQAPSLSVAFATNAGNASTLNGQPATTYLDRVAYASSSGSVPTAAGVATQIAGPLSITVPAGVSFVHVTGAVTGVTGTGDFIAWTQQDAVCALSGPSFDVRQFGNGSTQDSIGIDFVAAVTPGVHTFRLCAASANAGGMIHPNLAVETVQGGATGGTTITRPSGPGVDADNNPITAR